MYFIDFASENESDLYVTNVKENTRPDMLIEDITHYVFVGDEIYYKSTSNNLYNQSSLDSPAIRIATDISSFDIIDAGLIYMDLESSLYKMLNFTDIKDYSTDLFNKLCL